MLFSWGAPGWDLCKREHMSQVTFGLPKLWCFDGILFCNNNFEVHMSILQAAGLSRRAVATSFGHGSTSGRFLKLSFTQTILQAQLCAAFRDFDVKRHGTEMVLAKACRLLRLANQTTSGSRCETIQGLAESTGHSLRYLMCNIFCHVSNQELNQYGGR